MEFVIYFINVGVQILTLLIIVHILLGYLIPDENHPVRSFLSKIIEPLLAPIRKYLPQTGVFDFSPIVLILIVIVIQYIIVAVLRGVG